MYGKYVLFYKAIYAVTLGPSCDYLDYFPDIRHIFCSLYFVRFCPLPFPLTYRYLCWYLVALSCRNLTHIFVSPSPPLHIHKFRPLTLLFGVLADICPRRALPPPDVNVMRKCSCKGSTTNGRNG